MCPSTVAGVEEALRAVGASLRYLPQYSFDLNLIGSVFHPLKTRLRKAAERTIEELQRCIRSFILTLDPSECGSILAMQDMTRYDWNVLLALSHR